MDEQYTVTIEYKKTDGYWVIGKKVDVTVPTVAGKEKDSHSEAGKVAEKLYPGCKVTGVVYC